MAGCEPEVAGRLLERPAHPFDAGSTFVLAAGGLRRLRGAGEAFLGHSAGELFWRDVLELVHGEDLARAENLVAEAAAIPGSVLHADLRCKDASGAWRLVGARVRNLIEAPGDAGLVLADLHEADSPDGHAEPPPPPR